MAVLDYGPAPFSSSYFSFDEWGNSWYDANKSPTNPDDELMCWAAAGSNALAWTNWGFPSSESFQNENDIFSYFVDHWKNVGGGAYGAWMWWFEGYNYPNVEVPGGGFWTPPYDLNDYYHLINPTTKLNMI